MNLIPRFVRIITIIFLFGGQRSFIETNNEVDIYMMTCHRDIIKLIVALYSVYEYLGNSIRININHDQTLTKVDKLIINLIFKNIHILSEADFTTITTKLSNYPSCSSFYLSWMGKKLLNPLLLSTKKKIILLDSDLYFIKKPKEIIDFINNPYSKNLYAEDPPDYFLLSKTEFKYKLGIQSPIDRLNSSILCLYKKYIPSLRQVDSIISIINEIKKERTMDYSYLLEQTLFIYIYSKIPKIKKQPLSLRSYLNMAVNRHSVFHAVSLHFPTPSKNLWRNYLYLTKLGLFKNP